VVEDEPDVCRMARRALEAQGYRVLEAANGREALEVLDRHPAVALVVVDVLLPEIGGPELARRLAILRPELPALFTSGDPGIIELRADERTAARRVAFIGKPFTPDALALEPREVLDGRAAPATSTH
jgi:two-component system cell cycle sensor histidine kinase/response regulator CckA